LGPIANQVTRAEGPPEVHRLDGTRPAGLLRAGKRGKSPSAHSPGRTWAHRALRAL